MRGSVCVCMCVCVCVCTEVKRRKKLGGGRRNGRGRLACERVVNLAPF